MHCFFYIICVFLSLLLLFLLLLLRIFLRLLSILCCGPAYNAGIELPNQTVCMKSKMAVQITSYQFYLGPKRSRPATAYLYVLIPAQVQYSIRSQQHETRNCVASHKHSAQLFLYSIATLLVLAYIVSLKEAKSLFVTKFWWKVIKIQTISIQGLMLNTVLCLRTS